MSKVTIKELFWEDDELIIKVCKMLSETYNPEVSCFFIYQDQNYPAYFKDILRGNLDKVYYCEDSLTEEFIGFAHFKITPLSVFLNNIIIDTKYQGKNIGFFLLSYSLKRMKQENNGIETLELDVFEKNKGAFNWYLKLGMDISDYTCWYDITSFCSNPGIALLSDFSLANSSIKLLTDQNGFKQVYYDETYIGTVIDDKYLIVRTVLDYKLLKKLNLFFRFANLNSACLVSKKELELSLIDKAFHLTIPFEKLNLLNNPE